MDKNQVLIQTLQDCVAAWNRSDAKATASYYSPDCEYRDPNVPSGIHSRQELEKYLRILFRLWPDQAWTNWEVLPHSREGEFSVCYAFRFGNKRRSISGLGMDRIEFENGLLKKNWVYLNAAEWPRWIRSAA